MSTRRTSQTQTDQERLSTKSSFAPFERMEEYKVATENLNQYASRYLTTNAVFVGFNTLFLAAIGSLLYSTQFTSWWLIVKVAIISLTIIPVNIIWIRMLLIYRSGLKKHYTYLKTIEQEFQHPRQETNGKIGLWSILYPDQKIKHQHTTTEVALAWYFTILFPLILLVVAIVVYLVTHGFIPPAP